MTSRRHDVRPAAPSDLPDVIDVMTQAFCSTETFRWVVPDDEARPAVLQALFEASARHAQSLPQANLIATAPTTPTNPPTVTTPVLAAASWMPPGRWKTPWWRALRMAPSLLRTGARRTLREFGRRGPALDRALNRAHPSEPHWYLAVLATHPAAQGSGAGSALVHTGLERSRREGLPAYLECTEDLIDYYSRFGFTVIHTIRPSLGAPAQVGMWSS